MKRKITISTVLVLSIALLSLMASDPTATAAPPQRYAFDTGYLTPGANQFVRITVALGDTGTHEVRFRSIQASPGSCSGGICSHFVASQSVSEPFSLSGGDGLSMDLYSANPGQGVRGIVLTNSRTMRVNATIMNTITGEAGAVVTLLGTTYGGD